METLKKSTRKCFQADIQIGVMTLTMRLCEIWLSVCVASSLSLCGVETEVKKELNSVLKTEVKSEIKKEIKPEVKLKIRE